MNIELIADNFLPINEFYETSLNLSQPLFPKDLDKIKINGSAYLKINPGLLPLDGLDCDTFYSCQIDEHWCCQLDFQEKEIDTYMTCGYICVKRENLWETYIDVSNKIESYYEELTPYHVIAALYHYYLKIHSKLLQAKIEFDASFVEYSANDCLRRIVLDTQHESCSLEIESDNDLPF